MNKRITLDRTDIELLRDVLDYFLSNDGVEKQDFIDNHGDKNITEYDILDVDGVDNNAKSHIYYKLSKLQQELLGAENE